MSVTFRPEVEAVRVVVEEPCLCAQFAPSFSGFLDGKPLDRRDLESHSDADCGRCHGTGVEPSARDTVLSVNYSNDNARILLKALGLSANVLCGSCPVATMRAATMLALDTSHPVVIRAAVTSGRVSCGSFTGDDLVRALGELLEVLDVAEEIGAESIEWS